MTETVWIANEKAEPLAQHLIASEVTERRPAGPESFQDSIPASGGLSRNKTEGAPPEKLSFVTELMAERGAVEQRPTVLKVFGLAAVGLAAVCIWLTRFYSGQKQQGPDSSVLE